jgi:uncharacterized membrane protein
MIAFNMISLSHTCVMIKFQNVFPMPCMHTAVLIASCHTLVIAHAHFLRMEIQTLHYRTQWD